MIEVTQDKFVRTQNVAIETANQIARFPYASYVEDYKLHLKCLNKLLTELVVVPKMASTEGIESSEKIFNRMNEFSIQFS